jgi:hypothetical protein
MRHLLTTTALFCVVGPALAADPFERHSYFWLEQVAKNSQPLVEVSARIAAEWKTLGPGVASPCIVIRTSEGNLAKALLSWGFRKTDKQPLPVLLLERYVTYDNQRRELATAHGENVMLFPGFQFDFDIGQVVPEGLGGDVAFTENRRLVPIGEAALFGVNGPQVPGESETYDPNDHPEVRPRDFSGTWKIVADGRWRGTWELTADDDGNVQGHYLSDETKSTYPLEGRVSMAQPHQVSFTVQLANTEQQFELYLWTTDKSALAGVTTLLDKKFGVYALREAKAAPPTKPAE